MAHLQLHLESYHMTSCGNCLRFCGSQCTIYIAEHCELKSKRMLDNGILQKIKAAEAAKESLEICIRDRVDLSSSLSQDMGRLMDLGFEGPEALPWSRLLYQPTPEYPAGDFSPEVRKWVNLTVLEAALIDHITRIEEAGAIEYSSLRHESSMINLQKINHPDPNELHPEERFREKTKDEIETQAATPM